jgi:hypothetical protein
MVPYHTIPYHLYYFALWYGTTTIPYHHRKGKKGNPQYKTHVEATQKLLALSALCKERKEIHSTKTT